jgi:hypothetical protein
MQISVASVAPTVSNKTSLVQFESHGRWFAAIPNYPYPVEPNRVGRPARIKILSSAIKIMGRVTSNDSPSSDLPGPANLYKMGWIQVIDKMPYHVLTFVSKSGKFFYQRLTMNHGILDTDSRNMPWYSHTTPTCTGLVNGTCSASGWCTTFGDLRESRSGRAPDRLESPGELRSRRGALCCYGYAICQETAERVSRGGDG